MKLTYLFFGNKTDIKWELVKQMGINEVIVKLAPELTGMPSIDNLPSFQESKEIYDKNGFKIIGLEGDQFDMMSIKLGLKGKEAAIEKYQKMLENMGTLGIPLLCYNFMATGWYRTQTNILERGGALVSGFHIDDPKNEVLTKYGSISESQIWDNYQYFIEQVMPVAEANGVKMALHPDDPPIGPINGIARVFTSAQNIRKALSFSDSLAHGITFCQGSYVTMNEDIFELIAEFGKAKKIFFIHIRDVEGTPENFRETFHDNGPTDMYAAMKAYQNISLIDIPIRSDHVPTMAGESNDNFGYEMNGNLFGVGYIKGLIEASGKEILKN